MRGEDLWIGLKVIVVKYFNLFREVCGWGLINGMELNLDVELIFIDIVKVVMNEGLLIVFVGLKVLWFVFLLIIIEIEVMEVMDVLVRAIVNVVK